jgi:hypothetical protein
MNASSPVSILTLQHESVEQANSACNGIRGPLGDCQQGERLFAQEPFTTRAELVLTLAGLLVFEEQLHGQGLLAGGIASLGKPI